MDTTKEYIKMCEKAVEIQKLRCEVYSKLYCGDFYKGIGGKVRVCVEASKYLDKGVWLPRQDQLQEMLPDRFSNRNPAILAEKFSKYIGKELAKSTLGALDIIHYSMEQLWLAFVMKEKYNKTWNGKEWIK